MLIPIADGVSIETGAISFDGLAHRCRMGCQEERRGSDLLQHGPDARSPDCEGQAVEESVRGPEHKTLLTGQWGGEEAAPDQPEARATQGLFSLFQNPVHTTMLP